MVKMLNLRQHEMSTGCEHRRENNTYCEKTQTEYNHSFTSELSCDLAHENTVLILGN